MRAYQYVLDDELMDVSLENGKNKMIIDDNVNHIPSFFLFNRHIVELAFRT
jgi:hypothetical protein